MAMQSCSERVALRHAAAQPQLARLREPRGGDELALAGVHTGSAVQLLDRLLDAPPCSAGELSASDRDGLLAALHRSLWGDRIASSLECAACDAMYDLSFELSSLQRQLAQQQELARVDAPRVIEDARGERFQLPKASDEEAAAQLGVAAGCAQLLASITGGRQAAANAVGARLEALAPLIDVELDTRCPECGHVALARFDIQTFVLQRLLDEREGVLGEVHALAGGYGWSLSEILSLPRSLRRSLVQRLSPGAPAFG
jgi:hypothetical protein